MRTQDQRSELALAGLRSYTENMRALTYRAKIEKGGRIRLPRVPLPPGRAVEVIVLDRGQKSGNIYSFTAALTRRKGLKRMTLKEIASIVHESRGIEP